MLMQAEAGTELIRQGGPILAIGIGFALVVALLFFLVLKYFYHPMVMKSIDKAYEQVTHEQQQTDKTHTARERDLDRFSEIRQQERAQLVEFMRKVNANLERLNRTVEKKQ